MHPGTLRYWIDSLVLVDTKAWRYILIHPGHEKIAVGVTTVA